MRKQLYYALAALIMGSALAPEESQAAPLAPGAPAATTLSAATASHDAGFRKRKRGKKRHAGRHRRRR